MNVIEPEFILIYRTPGVRLLAVRAGGEDRWSTEITARSRTGVHYLLRQYEQRPTISRAHHDALRHGICSPRPYFLGQDIDPSVERCVMTLLNEWCEAHGLNATDLWREAYPESTSYTADDFQMIKAQALWERFILPSQWNDETVGKLVHALQALQHLSVAEAVLRRPGRLH